MGGVPIPPFSNGTPPKTGVAVGSGAGDLWIGHAVAETLQKVDGEDLELVRLGDVADLVTLAGDLQSGAVVRQLRAEAPDIGSLAGPTVVRLPLVDAELLAENVHRSLPFLGCQSPGFTPAARSLFG